MLEIYDIFNMQTNRQKGLEILFVLLVDTFVEDIVVSFGKCYNGKKRENVSQRYWKQNQVLIIGR